MEHLQLGQWIFEFTGELKVPQPNDKKSDYRMSYSDGLVLDMTAHDVDCKFVNHSHNPNCRIIKWNVSGELHLILAVSRAIMPDEELTTNYDLRYSQVFLRSFVSSGVAD